MDHYKISEFMKELCVSVKSTENCYSTKDTNINATWKANIKNIHIRSKLLYRCQNVRTSTKFVLGFLLPPAAWFGLCQTHCHNSYICIKLYEQDAYRMQCTYRGKSDLNEILSLPNEKEKLYFFHKRYNNKWFALLNYFLKNLLHC